eukprot:256307_1
MNFLIDPDMRHVSLAEVLKVPFYYNIMDSSSKSITSQHLHRSTTRSVSADSISLSDDHGFGCSSSESNLFSDSARTKRRPIPKCRCRDEYDLPNSTPDLPPDLTLVIRHQHKTHSMKLDSEDLVQMGAQDLKRRVRNILCGTFGDQMSTSDLQLFMTEPKFTDELEVWWAKKEHMMERKSNLETITDGDKSIPDLVSSNNPKTRKTGSGVSDSRLKDVSVGVSTGQESEQRPTNRRVIPGTSNTRPEDKISNGQSTNGEISETHPSDSFALNSVNDSPEIFITYEASPRNTAALNEFLRGDNERRGALASIKEL